jgi:predicted kinase
MIPEFVMLIGIPGSGKTDWLKKHKPDTHVVVCPDKIREKLTGSISDQSVNRETWREVYSRIIDALKQKINVILDATNLDTHFRNELLGLLPECKLIAIVFEIKPDEAFKRIQSAEIVEENRCTVPEYVVYRYYGDFLYTKKVLKSEGFEVKTIDSR